MTIKGKTIYFEYDKLRTKTEFNSVDGGIKSGILLTITKQACCKTYIYGIYDDILNVLHNIDAGKVIKTPELISYEKMLDSIKK